MRSEQSWSLLDPKPVLMYLHNLDEYIVYWNGIVMPHAMALSIAMEGVGIYPTPEMKDCLEKNYRKIYYSNGFDTRAWDSQISKGFVYSYLKRVMHEHVSSITENKPAQEILGWFDYSKARKLDYV
jgi:hypothetical protein